MKMTSRSALLFTTLALACAHRTTAPADAPSGEYRIGKEDLLEVSVWKDPALSSTVPVRPDGKVSLPVVGDLVAEGKTPEMLRREIAQQLVPYVKEPVVSVLVREVNSSKFSILGEVARP